MQSTTVPQIQSIYHIDDSSWVVSHGIGKGLTKNAQNQATA
jgi:hypothetical protein